LADQSNRPAAGLHALVVRAAFVPNGEQPPPELSAVFNPLKVRASLDPETGALTCDNAGTSFHGDIRAVFHPDEDHWSDDEAEDGATDGSEDGDRTLNPGKQNQPG
jgi:hypothetical protein